MQQLHGCDLTLLPPCLLQLLPAALHCLQLLPLSWLFIRLAGRYGVTFTDSSTLKSVGKLFAPTGGCMLLQCWRQATSYGIAQGCSCVVVELAKLPEGSLHQTDEAGNCQPGLVLWQLSNCTLAVCVVHTVSASSLVGGRTPSRALLLLLLRSCLLPSHPALPAGYLVLRTAAITFTYAIATGLTARAGPAAAACHQVMPAAATIT
jgi:hypothetical protein